MTAIDTNVLLYAVDPRDATNRADHLVTLNGNGTIYVLRLEE